MRLQVVFDMVPTIIKQTSPDTFVFCPIDDGKEHPIRVKSPDWINRLAEYAKDGRLVLVAIKENDDIEVQETDIMDCQGLLPSKGGEK